MALEEPIERTVHDPPQQRQAAPVAAPQLIQSSPSVMRQEMRVAVRDAVYSGEDETFAFHRALSRLREMQSAPYLDAARSRMTS